MAKKVPQKIPVQLPYLETFSEVAEKCSFTAAGKALGMTQAAVSQRIHALEKTLKKSLFVRNGTRIRLTEAGQELYGYAQDILRAHREAFESITGQHTPIAGKLSVVASSIPGEHFLPDLLATFQKKYPQIRVQATILDSTAAIHEVETGNVDVGLVGRKSESSHLEFRPFASDEMVLVVPNKHRWQGRHSVSFNQFAREPLILRESGSGSRVCFEEAIASSGKRMEQLNIVLELGGNKPIKQAVRKGMGVAILSSMAAKEEVDRGELSTLRIGGLSLARTMYIVLDTLRALPMAARMFVQVAQSSGDSDKSS